MTEGYLQILKESLEKKLSVLEQIADLNAKQYEISSHQPMDMEAYDRTMDEKGELIDALNRLDEGFGTTYEYVAQELKTHKSAYRELIKELQDLIRQVVEKGVEVEAQEKRNKSSMEMGLRMKRQEIKQMKISTSAATKYYKAMNKINEVDPQLMDYKK